MFISEIAPSRYRGGLNVCFQLLVTVGILCANLVNYGTTRLHPFGWRVSLAGASVPALILLGSFLIVETPTSLVERGKKDEALYTLKKSGASTTWIGLSRPSCTLPSMPSRTRAPISPCS